MRLPVPFIRLPLRFDAGRLAAELDALPAQAWAPHPNGIAGNESLRLITVDGGENDDVDGSMQATPWLRQAPYVRQVLASFNVVWSRSRFMRLAPGAVVPEHADINLHWFTRVRLHIPVRTQPAVSFHCDGQSVHMAAGEAWLFDNWRRHHVVNGGTEARVHLVADTSGTATFWQQAWAAAAQPGQPLRDIGWDAASAASPMFERNPPRATMPPAELDWLLGDLRGELALSADTPQARQQLAQYHALLQGFSADWRQLHALHGGNGGHADFIALRERVRQLAKPLSAMLLMRTNGVGAHSVLEGRVLRHLVAGPVAPAVTRAAEARWLDRPVFIVAAPRSGSTLLFETLAQGRGLVTCGGEAHWLIESHPELVPGAPGVDSNRLDATHVSAALAERIVHSVWPRLQDADGRPLAERRAVRWLEKTPKNALRIPFLHGVFPDAKFIFLRREPRGNIASIIEAWLSGRFVTYPQLAGWTGSWSLLLPPGWQSLRGKPLEEVAAHQWQETNRLIRADLDALPAGSSIDVDYDELVADPVVTIARLCGFIGIEFDAALKQRTAAALPASRYVLTQPDASKWQRHAERLQRVLAGPQALWAALQSPKR
ncbi:MAG: sulfotransferase [Steroidobacteraceae bacterium]